MSFARALFTVSGFTMLSRMAGFVRDTLTATFLGAGFQADAFFVAQRLPNLFRSLFAEGAFSAAFVPLYTKETEVNGEKAAQEFADHALAMLIALLTPFTILMIAAMPWVIRVMAPGFHDEPEKYALAVTYSQITFPYLLLISITALQSGVLNARGRFGPGAAAPIMLNIVLIAGLYLAHIFGWETGRTLAIATTISGGVQAGWLAISCWRARAVLHLVRPRLSQSTRTLFRQIGPGAVGAGAAQINLLLTTILASTLPTGAVSYLYYADRLNQLPLGILGIAVATTLLPLLSRHEAHGDKEKVQHFVSRAIEFCLILGLPAAVGLGIAAQPIIQTLFEHGRFTHADTLATAATLSVYALGVPAFLLSKVFASRFFSRQDTRTPVRIAMICMATNVGIALLLLGPMAHIGMAMATTCASWLNAALLYLALRKRGDTLGDAALKRRLVPIISSAIGMGLVAAFVLRQTAFLFENHAFWSQIGALTAIIGLSSVAYAVLLSLTGAVKLRDFAGLVGKQQD
ncbi:MAG: murein biosynthesis integral membrane protein MurJ [Alphaproteobacteria bacterium]|nr:murein biosynthesis integral membrane protein MurJ [Alphaproteobacteria bacterium]